MLRYSSFSKMLKEVYHYLKSMTKQHSTTSHNSHLDFGLPSWFVADLWSLCVHVHISFVFYLATEDLSPSLKTSLKTHSQDTLNLKENIHFNNIVTSTL